MATHLVHPDAHVVAALVAADPTWRIAGTDVEGTHACGGDVAATLARAHDRWRTSDGPGSYAAAQQALLEEVGAFAGVGQGWVDDRLALVLRRQSQPPEGWRAPAIYRGYPVDDAYIGILQPFRVGP